MTKKKVGIGLGIVALIVVPYIWGILVFPEWVPSVADRGQWGDSFGIVTSLFTVLAFIGVIWTIRQSNKQHREQLASQQEELRLQRKELELQREELKHTREEIKGQKEQLAVQNETLRHQNFESSFFQLLGLYNDIVGAMERSDGSHKILKRDCFRFMVRKFDPIYNSKQESNDLPAGALEGSWEGLLETGADTANDTKQLILERIDNRYEKFLTEHQWFVGHYFRHLYNAIKFVNEKDFLSGDEKCSYVNLIRAQLSSYELALLFYNCLSQRGKNFKCLVVKYALLKDMDFELLLYDAHKKLYKNDAYDESDSS